MSKSGDDDDERRRREMSASIGGPECTKLKKEYDECFNDWYTNQFLAGKSNLNECEDLFIDYKACVQKAMAEKQILPLLEQARREAPFEDGGQWKSK